MSDNQNNTIVWSYHAKTGKKVSSQKSTKNPMSSLALIEKNMELSHIHLAVLFQFEMDISNSLCKTQFINP